LSGFFGKLFQGRNQERPDLTVDDIPKSRMGMFFDMLGLHVLDLVKLNLLFVLFLIPAAVWVFANLQMLVELISEATELSSLSTEMRQLGYNFMMVFAPLLLPAGFGIAGMTYVCRNWARDDHAFIVHDFIGSLKANWKQTLGVMIFNVALIMILTYSNWFYAQMTADNIAVVLRYVLFILAALLLVTNIYIFPMMISYEMPLKQILRTSLILTIARLHFTLLILILTLLPLVLLFALTLAWEYGFIVLLLYYVLFGFSFAAFIINSYNNATFSKMLTAGGE